MRIWLIDLSIENDYLFCTIKYPPRWSVSEIVNCLKGVSSRKLQALFPELKGQCTETALWSPSYLAVSSGEPPQEIIRAFIREQHAQNQ